MAKNNKSSKNVVAPVEVSTIEQTLQQESTIAPATQETTATASVVAVKAISAQRQRFMDLAASHPLSRLQHDGQTYAPKNKGALMAALWYAVCAAVGYTNTSKANATLLTLCAKLGAHAVTHCASKGKALAGAEVSDNGAVGYARALKGALTGNVDQHSMRFAQYLIGGKRHDACKVEERLATLLVTLHGATEGIDAAKRAVGSVSV